MRKCINMICAGCLGAAIGIAFGGYWMGHKYCVKLVESGEISNKHLHMVRLYDNWMMTKQNGASIEKYLMDKGIHTIAIYGMSYMGIRLFHELKNSSVQIKYGIDREKKARIPGIDIYKPDEIKKEGVDAVVVTAVFAFDSVKGSLEKLGFEKIIALDEILYDLI